MTGFEFKALYALVRAHPCPYQAGFACRSLPLPSLSVSHFFALWSAPLMTAEHAPCDSSRHTAIEYVSPLRRRSPQMGQSNSITLCGRAPVEPCPRAEPGRRAFLPPELTNGGRGLTKSIISLGFFFIGPKGRTRQYCDMKGKEVCSVASTRLRSDMKCTRCLIVPRPVTLVQAV